jgi:hypothetical protein
MVTYYWCLTHDDVETRDVCRAANRLGPYASVEEARRWSERVEEREEVWDAEDERWRGEDTPPQP